MADSLDETSGLLPSDRRSFARKIGLAAACLGGAALLNACGGVNNLAAPPVQTPAITDADILNFALNLEYLEAEFYTYATTGNGIAGAGISTSGAGTEGLTTGGAQVSFTDPAVSAIAVQIATDEQDHVKLLRSALGAAAVAKPAINLNALGVGFATDAQFLTLARAFEDTGVSAYGGAAPLITSATTLGTAAQILGTEAEHSGNIRLLVVEKAIAVGALDSSDVLPSASTYFAVNSDGLSVIRSPRQVLNIVYGGSGASGGFFPSGMNGAITD
ncbi:MAG: ferritin-like domain-containing protein [Terriglobales bacterium]